MARPMVDIVIDPSEWFKLKAELVAFEPSLAIALRRQIKSAGNLAVEAVKKKLEEPPPSGGGYGAYSLMPSVVGIRAALIAGTRDSVSFTARSAGVRIVTSGSGLGEHIGMLKAYNKGSFRHPVFGNTSLWVEQRGNPYFDKVIETDRVQGEMMIQIRESLDAAVAAIGAIGL